MKDSGVAWIGEIPQGWTAARIKGVFREVSTKGFPLAPLLAATQHAGVILKSEVGWRTMEAKVDGRENFKLVCEDDFVISLRSFEGGIEKSSVRGIISPAYTVLRLRDFDQYTPEYFKYFLKSAAFLNQLKQHQKGIRDGQAIPFGTLEYDFIAVPPLSEQHAIADYLDRQTALIDQRLTTLAEKKTVLAELRKATIHEAVTKGLSKTASMHHWTTVRIKDVAQLNPPTLLPKLDEVDFFPMEAIGVDGGLTLGQRKAVTQAGGYSQMKNGDVCFAKVTPCFENGKSAIVEGLDTKAALATTEITVLRPNKKISRHFLHYRIKGLDFASDGANEMKGAGGLKRVPERFASDFVFQLPPLSEQLAIADHLDQQTQQFDAQLATLDEQAQVLKELRKAIIHEAVTGKIDLSGCTPQPRQAIAA